MTLMNFSIESILILFLVSLLIVGMIWFFSTQDKRKAKRALQDWINNKDGKLLEIIDIGKLAKLSEKGSVHSDADQRASIDVTGVGHFFVDGGVEIKFIWEDEEGVKEERWATYVPSSGLFKVRSL